MIPGLYMMSLFIGYCMYYTSMSKPGYPMLIQLICVPMHAFWCYLLMFYFEMGYKGCAIAFNFTYTLSFLLILLIGKFSPDPEI
jgi:Na+-driven multidrug efflux pump